MYIFTSLKSILEEMSARSDTEPETKAPFCGEVIRTEGPLKYTGEGEEGPEKAEALEANKDAFSEAHLRTAVSQLTNCGSFAGTAGAGPDGSFLST